MKAISLWSGGKDSCLAFWKAKSQGYQVTSLVNFTSPDAKNSLSHGLPAMIIQKQAESTGIPFLQKPMSGENYERDFIALILKLKENEGIGGIVFGDIYLQEHKDWIDKVCKQTGVEPVMPLWGQDTSALVNEFIDDGFRAIIVSARKDLLSHEWLGREIDAELIKNLKEKGNIDLCGEKGEFHTFVYDGPIFEKPVKFTSGRTILKDNYWFLELIDEGRG